MDKVGGARDRVCSRVVSEPLGRGLKPLRIPTVCKPFITIRNVIFRPKDTTLTELRLGWSTELTAMPAQVLQVSLMA